MREGINRFRVFTPFRFEDGDHLAIVLKEVEKHWILSDEGHTFMHLTYDLDERDLHTGSRQKVISNALSLFGVEDHDGELVIEVPGREYGNALYSFVQALLKITDVSYLSRERVHSTFPDDYRSLITRVVPVERRTFDWTDPEHDEQGIYPISCRINGMAKPLFVFALSNDDNTRDATITIHQFESWHIPFQSMAIFEDQERINRKVLARFSDVCGKQFSSLGPKKRIERYIEQTPM